MSNSAPSDVEKAQKLYRGYKKKLVEDVDSVVDVEDGESENDYIIKFDKGASWDVYRDIIQFAPENFKVVTEYERVGNRTVRFTIEESDAINANIED